MIINEAFKNKSPVGHIHSVRHGTCSFMRLILIILDRVLLAQPIIIGDPYPHRDQSAVEVVLADHIHGFSHFRYELNAEFNSAH